MYLEQSAVHYDIQKQQKWSVELSYTVYFLRESLCDIVVCRSSHKFVPATHIYKF